MSSVLEELNLALGRTLAADERVYLLGEDLLDPYGGAFKVTRGLSSAYPQRVLATPISEAGITGLAAGMALRGLRPVVEIMFGDFLTLAADQLVNHIAKFRWMYNDQVRLPLVIRTPMGGRRGYGPTHSQTLEKHFLGLPGLRVLAPAALSTSSRGPGDLLFRAVTETEDPLLFIENKLGYLLPVHSAETLPDFTLRAVPAGYHLSVSAAPPAAVTLAAYGYMAELARQAVLRLAYEYEIFCELLVLTHLVPFDLGAVSESLERTGRLLTVEEGTLSLGWGAEVLSRAAETLAGSPGSPRPLQLRRLAAGEFPVPAAASLESAVLPGVESIISSVRSML